MMPGRSNTTNTNTAVGVMMMVLVAVMAMDLLLVPSEAFVPYCSQQQRSNPNSPSVVVKVPSRLLAGFGSGGGGGTAAKKKNKKNTKETTKNTKLKPRQQWDRFLSEELKTAEVIRVACCKKDTEDANNKKWFEIGQVKSVDNAFTDAAVIRHRALMAEHARRMFPVQILVSDQLEWGYTINSEEGEEDSSTVWTTVTKMNKETVLPDDIDKKIGFRGNADPTGFYASSQAGLKAGDTPSMQQTGYLNMKSKGITGITAHEVHD
jgi:hypothetical protein